MKKYLFGTLFSIVFFAGIPFAQGDDPPVPGGLNFTSQLPGGLYVPSKLPAKNIYLDNNGAGGDGSMGNPYGAFSEINWSTISGWIEAGYPVNINLKRGVTWQEQLKVGASGTGEHRITIQPYGAGASPVIDGYGTIRSTVSVDGVDYIILDGLEIKNGKSFSVHISKDYDTGKGSNNIIVQNCNIHGALRANIYVNIQNNLLIQNNEIHGSIREHGIYLDGLESPGNNNAIIQYNDIHHNGNHQIQLNCNGQQRVKDAIIRYNVLRDGVNGHGVALIGDEHTQIYGNLIYNVSYMGICTGNDQNQDPDYNYVSRNALIYNNTIYLPSAGKGIKIGNYSTGHIIKNNIIYKGNHYSECVTVSNTGSATFDNNLYYKTTGEDLIRYHGIYYNTLTQWQNASGQDLNSKFQDPLFTNPGNKVFTLRSTSPAKTGAEVIRGYTKRLSPNSVWPDSVFLVENSATLGAYGY